MGVIIKQFRMPFACVAAALLLCAGGLPRATNAEDLRIGFIAPFTGPFAQQGADMKNGFNMYLDEVRSNFDGAKVVVIFEDDEGKVPVGVSKAEKLVGQDKVHMLVGGVLATTGYALAQVSTRTETPYILPVAAADDLTQRQKAANPFIVRTGWTGSQTTHPLGQWACEQGYKRIAAVSADYAFGHESLGGFQQVFEGCGGKIVQKIWPPLGTVDFGPFLAQIKRDVDAVFTMMVGPMIPQFPKQYKAAGMKMPLIGQGTGTDEASLGFMDDDSLGYVTALQYSAAINTPRNIAFVKKFRSLYHKIPGYYAETVYTTGEWIHEAMKQTKGKWPGAAQFVANMQKVQLKNAIRGPLHLDNLGNPVQTVYIRKVERKQMFGFPNAELWNVIIKTYPNVSQFWNIPQDKYLAAPLYTREYPPCKYCE